MLRRTPILVLLVLLLAACGGQQATNTATNAAPVAVAPAPTVAAAKPEDTVNQAIKAMANRDQATLADLYDSSVATYAAPFALTAINDWNGMKNEVDPMSAVALGPIASQEMGAPDTAGQTTRVVVKVTYEIGKADWIFSLRQRDQAWRLLEVRPNTTERKHP